MHDEQYITQTSDQIHNYSPYLKCQLLNIYILQRHSNQATASTIQHTENNKIIQ